MMPNQYEPGLAELTLATVADLQPGDHIGHQWPELGFPDNIRGTVTHVEDGPVVGLWLDQTGDMRWLLAAGQGVAIGRMRNASTAA